MIIEQQQNPLQPSTKNISSEQQCQLCSGQNMSIMLNRALYDRYFTNTQLYYTNTIQDFIDEQITPQTCKFKQQLCDFGQEQYLKREYHAEEYQNKIQMLSEYYKFHRDVPRIFDKKIFNILGKYYDRLRHYDYKRIKVALKQEQGVSLTTEKSQESSFHSSIELKSKYSTVLGDLNQNSQTQSQILQDFCNKADKALDKVNYKKQFKGQYYSGQKKFQQYLLNMKKVNSNVSQKEFIPTNKISSRNKNYNLYPYQLLQHKYNNTHGFTLKSARSDPLRKKSYKKNSSNQQNKTNNNILIKQSFKNFKKIKNYNNTKSIQKTTANQTISRQEQRSRKLDKFQKTIELEIEKNNINFNNHMIFKPFNNTGIIGFKQNYMLKTLDQIYKPISSSSTTMINQKYHSDKSRKSSHYGGGKQSNMLNKMYQNKLSSRKSNSKKGKSKSKVTSAQNSKQINSDINNPNFKDYILINANPKGQMQGTFALNKQKSSKDILTRYSSKKRLSRSKSVSKTLHQTQCTTNKKKSQKKQFKTIDYPFSESTEKRKRTFSSHKRLPKQHQEPRLSKYTHDNNKFSLTSTINVQNYRYRPSQLKQRSESRKNLHILSNKKQRQSSSSLYHKKPNTKSPSTLQKSSSKSNISSARNNTHNQNNKKLSNNINNFDKFLEKKLTIIEKKNVNKGKKSNMNM